MFGSAGENWTRISAFTARRSHPLSYSQHGISSGDKENKRDKTFKGCSHTQHSPETFWWGWRDLNSHSLDWRSSGLIRFAYIPMKVFLRLVRVERFELSTELGLSQPPLADWATRARVIWSLVLAAGFEPARTKFWVSYVCLSCITRASTVFGAAGEIWTLINMVLDHARAACFAPRQLEVGADGETWTLNLFLRLMRMDGVEPTLLSF